MNVLLAPGGRKKVCPYGPGASIVEFMIILPLLLLLFIGLFEVGRMMAQVETLSQGLCSAALFGAGLPGTTAERKDLTEKMAYRLFDSSVKKEFDQNPPVTPTFEAQFDSITNSVRLSFQGVLRVILPAFFSREMTRQCIVPELGPGALEYSENFTNPSPPFCSLDERTVPCPPTDPGNPPPTPIILCTTHPSHCSTTPINPTYQAQPTDVPLG